MAACLNAFLERVLGLRLVRRCGAARVVEDHADRPCSASASSFLDDVGLAEVVGEDVEFELRVGEHLVQQREDRSARREPQPGVLLGVGELLAIRVGSGDVGGVVQQIGPGPDDPGRAAEVVDVGLRLHVSTREREPQRALLEAVDQDLHRRAQRGVERQQLAVGVEVSRRDRVGVCTHDRLQALMVQARHVQPAELVKRGVDARVRRLGRVPRMLIGVLELQSVPQEVLLLARGPTGDGEASEPSRRSSARSQASSVLASPR